MKITPLLSLVFAAVSLLGAGCATTLDNHAPLSSYNQGGGAGIITTILSPQDNQTLPAGKDIHIKAGANSFSSINRVAIIVNGRQIALDHRRPYTATLPKAAPGTYIIHSVAYDIYGASRSSMGVVITVK